MDILNRMKSLEQEADDFGFSWENTDQIVEQIKSELIEINAHLHQGYDSGDKESLQEEIGDLFHAVMSLCVFCKLNPEQTLEKTTLKFERRLKAVKALAKKDGLSSLKGFDFDELMEYWNLAKKQVG